MARCGVKGFKKTAGIDLIRYPLPLHTDKCAT